MSKVTVKDYSVAMITAALPQALQMLGEQVRADSDQFVPRLTGDLRTYISFEAGAKKVGLVYESKYAAYQWYGNGMKNYTTPGTGAEWCEKARNVYGADWEKVLANAIFKGAGF